MIFAHSFSRTEQTLFHSLQKSCDLYQLDCSQISGPDELKEQLRYTEAKTLLYSFQKLDAYSHLDSFRIECERVSWLVDYVIENDFDQLVILSWPGAYFNSSNLFLQHKGMIEQKFVQSGIRCTLLNVQAIGDRLFRQNNFHELFFDKQQNAYIIPQRSNFFVYSITVENLSALIQSAFRKGKNGKYDAFDTIMDLRSFLGQYSSIQKIQRLAPIYLYYKSFLGSYVSPTMLELFLLTVVPMYKFRTEKELGVTLDDETIHNQIINAEPIRAYPLQSHEWLWNHS
jgi:hypothetical protein